MGGGQVGCERRIEVFLKIQKQNFFSGGGGGRGSRGRGRVGGVCERRTEVFVKIHFFFFFFFFFFFGGGGGGWGQGGCESRIEVF